MSRGNLQTLCLLFRAHLLDDSLEVIETIVLVRHLDETEIATAEHDLLYQVMDAFCLGLRSVSNVKFGIHLCRAVRVSVKDISDDTVGSLNGEV